MFRPIVKEFAFGFAAIGIVFLAAFSAKLLS
jgi:hypothetical protein